jgi:iron complex outermembrane receptor protein
VRSRVPVAAIRGELVLRTQAIRAETVTFDPLFELGQLASETRTPGQRVEQSVEASEQPFDGLWLRQQVTLAADRLQRFERRRGSLEPALSARRFGARLTGSGELRVRDDWFVAATLGLACSDTSTAELAACGRVDPDGRLGLSFRRSSYELYANAGRYLREPTLGELHGVALLVRGNDDLLPERGTSYELGARWQLPSKAQTPPLYADAALFSRHSDDLISYVRTAQGYLTPLNRNRAETRGAEFVLGTAPVSFFEARSQLSLLDARDTSPDRVTQNDVLPFASRLVSATELSLRHRLAFGPLDEGGMTGRWTHQSSRYADPAGLGVIPAQSWLDFELFLRSLDRVSTRARLANVLDQRRFDVVGFPLPGRSVFVSVEATW